MTGAVVGAGFNAYYTAGVCEAAYYLYRERFLARKYGDNVIDLTVAPTEQLDPTYEGAFEDVPGRTGIKV